MSETIWVRREDGTLDGPISVIALRQKLLTRKLDQSVHVAQSEDGPWYPLSELHAVQDFSSEPDDARFVAEAGGSRIAGTWRRWFARNFDTLLAFLLVGMAVWALLPWLPALDEWIFETANPIAFTVLALALGLALDAAIYGIFGNTLGKALLGIRVVREDGQSLGAKQYLIRNLQVMIQGYGLGVPLVNLATFLFQWVRVNKGRPASYDASPGYRVEAKPLIGIKVMAFIALSVAVVLLLIF